MPKHNQFAAFHDESSDEETEHDEVLTSKRDELLRCGRAFWLEQQRGKRMKWGDWCDESDEEQEQPIKQKPLSVKQNDDFIVQRKNKKKRNKKGKRC
jgi:hypothetical protein